MPFPIGGPLEPSSISNSFRDIRPQHVNKRTNEHINERSNQQTHEGLQHLLMDVIKIVQIGITRLHSVSVVHRVTLFQLYNNIPFCPAGPGNPRPPGLPSAPGRPGPPLSPRNPVSPLAPGSPGLPLRPGSPFIPGRPSLPLDPGRPSQNTTC